MVSTELPDPVTEVGANFAVTPVGNPLIPNCTFPVKPARAVMVTVVVALLPLFTPRVEGESEIEKSPGGGFTTIVAVALGEIPGLVPCTVMGYMPGGGVNADVGTVSD